VDESVTGSVNFFGPTQGGGQELQFGVVAFPPRPPAFSPGFTSFVWAIVFGGFIWVGLLAIGVSGGTAFLFGLVSAVVIFFYVRLFGADLLRR
jgi:hypothetical protein